MNRTTKFEDAAYNLITELSAMATAACDEHDINGVYWLVSEIRRVDRLIRAVEQRLVRK